MEQVLRIFFTLSLIILPTMAQTQTAPYQNPDLPVDERVNDLLGRMKIQEKIGQMTQLDITTINKTGHQSNVELDPGKAKELIGEHHIGSFLNGEAVPAGQWFQFMDRLTRLAVNESRLGIPIIYGIDHIHGASYLGGATIFPQSINLGATFNEKHSYNAGAVTALESADLGHQWNFAPVLDLGVNPVWPRIWETYGEDPHLASVMGRSYVNGLQSAHKAGSKKMAATAKHFIGYSDPKSGWDRSPAHIPDQVLHEFHKPPFKAAIDAGIKTVMLNSGEVNGVPVHASHRLVTGLLREEMGFDGVILTDWADIKKLVNFHYTAEDYKEATYQAVMAGVDMSMTPLTLEFNRAMTELVEEGWLSEERIDASVRRILTLKFELGLFEDPYPTDDRLDKIGSTENRQKALDAARESIVLLRNSGDVLPLEAPGKIIVTGPTADSKRNLSGGWTIAWQGGEEEQYPEDMMTILDALRAEFPNGKIVHATGIPGDKELNDADLVVYAGGEEPYTEFIGNISDLTLPQQQLKEIAAIARGNTPLALVLVQGRPRLITDVAIDAEAIIMAGLPGFEGAEAIANVISGTVNPSGKLPISYPMDPNHYIPYNHKSSDVYFFDGGDPNEIIQGDDDPSLFPFGHGLSYTTFDYSNLTVSSRSITTEESLRAEVTITNTGDRQGMEGALWFITDHVGRITRPVEELQHFEKVSLEPGESVRLEFKIDPTDHLAYPDENGKLNLEPGRFTIKIGDLTKEFRLKAVK
jgi:beta-glucosidase